MNSKSVSFKVLVSTLLVVRARQISLDAALRQAPLAGNAAAIAAHLRRQLLPADGNHQGQVRNKRLS